MRCFAVWFACYFILTEWGGEFNRYFLALYSPSAVRSPSSDIYFKILFVVEAAKSNNSFASLFVMEPFSDTYLIIICFLSAFIGFLSDLTGFFFYATHIFYFQSFILRLYTFNIFCFGALQCLKLHHNIRTMYNIYSGSFAPKALHASQIFCIPRPQLSIYPAR